MTEELRYRLIGTPFSTFTRSIAMALESKGLAYEQIVALPHSTEAESHSNLGFIPVLYDRLNNIKLTESIAILHYLQRQHPEEGPNLFLPSSFSTDSLVFPERVDELSSFAATQVYPKVEFGVVKPRLSFTPSTSSSPEENQIALRALLQPGIEDLKLVLEALEVMLEAGGMGPYSIGSSLTAADCLLFPPLADLMAIPEGEMLKGYIRVKAWLDFFSETDVAVGTKEGTLENGDRP